MVVVMLMNVVVQVGMAWFPTGRRGNDNFSLHIGIQDNGLAGHLDGRWCEGGTTPDTAVGS